MSGPRAASESLLSSRPGSHLPRSALPSLAPLPSSTFLYTSSGLPPSIRRPRALIRPLACASLALNLPLRAASRKPDSSAISHVQCRMSFPHSTIGWDSSAFPINFFSFPRTRYQEISTRIRHNLRGVSVTFIVPRVAVGHSFHY